MAKYKGVCRNIDGCSKARSREVQEADKTSFICAECEKELKPIDDGGGGESGGGNKMMLIVGIAIILIGAAVAIFFIFRGDSSEAVIEDTTVIEQPQPDPVVEVEPVAVVEVEPEPVVEPQPEPEVKAKPATATATSGTLTLADGVYVGDIKNGKANGPGKMTYKVRTLISKYDRQKRYAEPGEYVIGTWYDGKLDFGKLFTSGGDFKETLTIGRVE